MTGYIDRLLLISLEKYITKPFVHILFGARQTGNSEVDFIVRIGNNIIPVEVKWSSNPSIKDVSSLVSFIRENPLIKTGYVVCRCQRPAALSDRITAIPWQSL